MKDIKDDMLKAAVAAGFIKKTDNCDMKEIINEVINLPEGCTCLDCPNNLCNPSGYGDRLFGCIMPTDLKNFN